MIPSLTAQENKINQAILIVDKIGVIGERLSQELSKDYIVFFLSNRPLTSYNKKIVQVPFKGNIPKVIKNNYSKIFIIDDGSSIIKESTFSFIKKAKLIGSDFYYLSSIRNLNLKYSNDLIKSYDRLKVLIFGDLFDNEFQFDKNSSITRYIYEVRKNKKIKVRGDGLSLNYPITFEDTIKLIIKAVYIKIPEKAILLFSQHPITDISLANTFKKIDPEIDVDFVNSPNTQELYIPRNREFALSKYDIVKKLGELNLNEISTNIVEYKKNYNRFSFIKPVLFFVLACIFLVLLPLLSTYTYTFLGLSQIKSAKAAADNGNFEKALEKINNSKTFFELAKQTSGPLEYEASLIGFENKLDSINKQINSGINLSNASLELLNGLITLKNINSKEDLNLSINYFKNANVMLQELKATNQFPRQMDSEFQNLMPLVELISNSSDVASDILGFDKEKTYLVLFQNNFELRPGGGVIENIGILKIKDGKILSFEMQNTKELDEKLNVFIASPFFLRRHVPLDNYYLSDASSNPDFESSAKDVTNIYKVITGIEVDGVIGLNLGLAKRLMNLENLNEKFNNSENTNFNLLENESSNLSFYNDLMGNLSQSLNKNLPYSEISEIIGSAISEKEILFTFKDKNIQNIFTVNNLSGNINENRKININTVNDYFGISESNIGKNKSNNLISRSISRELKINEENFFTSDVKISFKNDNLNTNYKNYLKLILPAGSIIQDLSVGGRNVDVVTAVNNPLIYENSNFRPPQGFEIEQVNQGDKVLYGFIVNVPPQSMRVVNVSYNMPFKFVEAEKFINYSLYIYKQPGVENLPFEQKFNLPAGFKVLPTDSFSSVIRKDEIFNFIISDEN